MYAIRSYYETRNRGGRAHACMHLIGAAVTRTGNAVSVERWWDGILDGDAVDHQQSYNFV